MTIKYCQPDLSKSWSLRTQMENAGGIRASCKSPKAVAALGIAKERLVIEIDTRRIKSPKTQYSLRLALPEKFA